MPRYDKDQVKQAAEGQWPDLISRIAAVDIGILDCQHHPCPQCGGTDRFNLDRKEGKKTGHSHCNKCGTNADGFATIQWLTGDDFLTALQKVADVVGVKPKRSNKANPEDNLEFLPWNDTTAGLWCLEKPPITAAALKAAGCRMARYRNQFSVIAVPVRGPGFDIEKPSGWVIYRTDGGKLPVYSKGNQEPSWEKMKNTAGSIPGVIGDPREGEGPVIKVEGPTDYLALISAVPDARVFTNMSGAKENPLDWIIESIRGLDAIVIHDADEPGQQGATYVPKRGGEDRPGWAPRMASTAKSVVNLTLPFEVEKTNGPDLRDYFNGGGTWEALLARIPDCKRFTIEEAEEKPLDEDEDDPHRLAKINLQRYQSEHDGRLIYWRDEWWKWKDGKYRQIEIAELKAKVTQSIRKEFEQCFRERKDGKPVKKVTRSLVSNVVGAMESICVIPSSIPMPCWLVDRSQPHYIATVNGILDLDGIFEEKDEVLQPHSPEWFSSFRLDYPFDINAQCPTWSQTIAYSMENDPQRIRVLQEWAGYLLTNSNSMQRFLALEGEGSNGKTVYFAAMTAMLGEDNVSHVSIENFGGQFSLGCTLGKAANISGDAGDIDHVAEGILKQFTGGDTMQFDRKNQSMISARPTAKLMASWNTRPKIKDKSDGLWRRMLLVPFKRRIEAGAKVRGMDDAKFWIDSGEAQGILNWAILGLHRLREQGEFTQSDVIDSAMSEFKQQSNPVLEFIGDHIVFNTVGQIKVQDVYEIYRSWCGKGNNKPLTRANFGKQIRKSFPGVERKRVGSQWFYVGLEVVNGEEF